MTHWDYVLLKERWGKKMWDANERKWKEIKANVMVQWIWLKSKHKTYKIDYTKHSQISTENAVTRIIPSVKSQWSLVKITSVQY